MNIGHRNQLLPILMGSAGNNDSMIEETNASPLTTVR
jgi:hypothetical protein